MTENSIKQASKDDIAAELIRLKARARKEKESNKLKGQKAVESIATVGTGAGLSYLIAGRVADAKKAEGFDGLTAEEQAKKIKEAQSVVGIDIDLLVGVAGLGLGMTDSVGEYSGVFTAAGAGALTAFASRALYEKRLEQDTEEA